MASTSTTVGGPSKIVTWVLRTVVVGYLFFLVAWPSGYVVKHTFANGTQGIQDALADPDVVHALQLTATVSVIAVLINLVFGVGISLLLVRQRFVGRRALSALIDLPLSVSPIVVGLALVLVYNGRFGWFGPTLEAHGLQVVFAEPGMIMATCFVSLPLVIREVVPVLEEIGDDQEQAAHSLGANAWQSFWRTAIDGRTPGEVGAELSMSAGAVRVAKCRVLKRLREELGDLDRPPDSPEAGPTDLRPGSL